MANFTVNDLHYTVNGKFIFHRKLSEKTFPHFILMLLALRLNLCIWPRNLYVSLTST